MRRRQARSLRGQRKAGGGGLAPRNLVPPGWGIPILAGLGVIAVVAVLAFAVIQATGGGESSAKGVAQEQDQSTALPGQWINPGAEYPDTAPHVEQDVPHCEGEPPPPTDSNGRPICYASTPPTSGPHSGTPARWGIYDARNPVEEETFVHNMEHGGVVVTYNCTNCDDVIRELGDIVEGYLNDRRLIVMTPYDQMEAETIALASWSRLEKFPVSEFSKDRVQRYVEAHERRFNPEGF